MVIDLIILYKKITISSFIFVKIAEKFDFTLYYLLGIIHHTLNKRKATWKAAYQFNYLNSKKIAINISSKNYPATFLGCGAMIVEDDLRSIKLTIGLYIQFIT